MVVLALLFAGITFVVGVGLILASLEEINWRIFRMSQALEQELVALRAAVAALQAEASASFARIAEDVAELLRRLDEAGEAPTQAQLDEIRALAVQIQEVASSEASQDPLPDFPPAG